MAKLHDLKYPIFAVVLTVAAFFVFKLLLGGQAPQYASEIAAAVFGGLLTIVVTAIMLHKQTEVDMKKDRSAKMLEAKLALYEKLMEEVGQILSGTSEAKPDGAEAEERPSTKNIRDHVVAVQVLSQRLAVLGSISVVESFSEFAAVFAKAARDDKLNDREKDELLDALGRISVQMHADILAGEEKEEFEVKANRDRFVDAVTRNVNSLKTKAITQQGFLDACDERERAYFESLVASLEQDGWTVTPRTSGLTVTSRAGTPMLWCFPSKAKRNMELHRENIPATAIGEVLAVLKSLSVADDRLAGGKRIAFRTSEVPLDQLMRIMKAIGEAAEAEAA